MSQPVSHTLVKAQAEADVKGEVTEAGQGATKDVVEEAEAAEAKAAEAKVKAAEAEEATAEVKAKATEEHVDEAKDQEDADEDGVEEEHVDEEEDEEDADEDNELEVSSSTACSDDPYMKAEAEVGTTGPPQETHNTNVTHPGLVVKTEAEVALRNRLLRSRLALKRAAVGSGSSSARASRTADVSLAPTFDLTGDEVKVPAPAPPLPSPDPRRLSPSTSQSRSGSESRSRSRHRQRRRKRRSRHCGDRDSPQEGSQPERMRGYITVVWEGGGEIRSSQAGEAPDSLRFEVVGLQVRIPAVGDLVEFSLVNLRNGSPFAVNVRHIDSAMERHTSRAEATHHQPAHPDVLSAKHFMRRHACRTQQEEYTHSSMAGFRDQFAQGTGRFHFGDDPKSREELAKALAVFFRLDRGKLYLTEHPSEWYAFVEDIDVEGSGTSGTPDIMRPADHDFELLKWRATALRKMFPTARFRCAIYSASGWYTGSELYKESYHLVWKDIIVNKDRAVKVRLATLEEFERWSQKPDHPLQLMLKKVLTFNKYNTWEHIFDATTTRPKVGLRMPFCDKRSRLPTMQWQDEHRPVEPVGEVTFEFEKSRDSSMEICTRVSQVEPREQRAQWEWALSGMCRRPLGTGSTYFREPVLERPPPPAQMRKARKAGPGSGTSRRAAPLASARSAPRKSGTTSGAAAPVKAVAPIASTGQLGQASSSIDVQFHDYMRERSQEVGGAAASSLVVSSDDDTPAPTGAPSGNRLFRGGSSEAFCEAMHGCLKLRAHERKEIQGGVQIRIPNLGSVNFFEKTQKVLLQGNNVMELLRLVEPWTDPAPCQ